MTQQSAVRHCAVCGMFYPAEKEELLESIRSMLEESKASGSEKKPLGAIVPHAGYLYSGMTAAAAYARMAGHAYDTVVVVSPSHREFFQGVSVFPGEAYETPLGSVPVNTKLRDKLLAEQSVVKASHAGHGEEHAIEVQLPFLQTVLHSFTLLPLVIGNQTRDVCFELGRMLGNLLAPEHDILLVASTDLSHYYPAGVAEKFDSIARTDIEAFDPVRLMDDLDAQRTEACGGGPTVAVMTALRDLGAKTMQVVHHCNSGDVTGDRRAVVGYCSAIAWR